MTPDKREEILAGMHQEAGNKAGHAAYINACVRWQENGGKADDEPNSDDFQGVSFAYAVDIAADVERLHLVELPGTHYPAPNRYVTRRRRAKSGASRAAAFRKQAAATSAVAEKLSFLNLRTGSWS